MIVETLIATVGAIVIVGTVAGLRFAEREMGIAPNPTSSEQREALQDVERWMRLGCRSELRALLAVRPHHLPDDVRERAQAWLDGRPS
jgi:hypothetical protein